MPTISQSELESYLWGAATLLRGTLDAGDYKQYIFPLLFLKRLCDVYDEERSVAKERYGDDYFDFPEDHPFLIPADSHWNAIRVATTDVGTAIQSAMRE